MRLAKIKILFSPFPFEFFIFEHFRRCSLQTYRPNLRVRRQTNSKNDAKLISLVTSAAKRPAKVEKLPKIENL